GRRAHAGRPQPPDAATPERFTQVPRAPGSPQRERIDTPLYIPETARETPAPAVLLPHGFGGSKQSATRDAQELAERGFVVLAYSARGHGRSTGKIGLNDPEAEVADAGKLLDYLAAQSTVAKDADGDPNVAVAACRDRCPRRRDRPGDDLHRPRTSPHSHPRYDRDVRADLARRVHRCGRRRLQGSVGRQPVPRWHRQSRPGRGRRPAGRRT